MDNETDRDDPPEIQVTMNQVVAYNIAYFRKIRGRTQEDLGEALEKITGKKWSKATMSAVERSWDGNRIRSFDADDLLAFCQALEVPLTAFFLPPTEDRLGYNYLFKNAAEPNSDKPWGDGYGLVINLFTSRDEHGYAEDAAFRDRLEAVFSAYGEPDEAFVSRPGDFGKESENWGGYEHQGEVWNQIAVLRKLLSTLERSARKLSGVDEEPPSKEERERKFAEELRAEQEQLRAERDE